MAEVIGEKSWSTIRQLETHELARGGINGNMNEQAKALADRTEYLRQNSATKDELANIAGGNYGFNTLEEFELVKDTIPVNSTIKIGNAGDYIWDGVSLTKSLYDPLHQANSYTDQNINPIKQRIGGDQIQLLEIGQDDHGFIYRLIDQDGNVKYVGKKLELQNISVEESESNYAFILKTTNDDVLAFIDPESNFHVAGDINFNGGSLSETIDNIQKVAGNDISELLEIGQDDNGFVYRFIDQYGNVKYVGKKIDLQNISIEEIESSYAFIVKTTNDDVLAFIDSESNLNVAGDVIFNGGKSLKKSLDNVVNTISSEKLYRKIAGQTYQNSLINKYNARSEFTSVITLADTPNLINRMPAAVKIPTGLFMVWHQRTKQEFDGDGSGSAFWRAFVDIDSNFNLTIRDKKLFIYPDTDAGIVKHPHLGRTTDNRLILVYEKSIGYVEETASLKVNYIRYVRYSSDDGGTWTEPQLMNYTNNPPTTALKALGTTCEVLKLQSGRLIVALYSAQGHCGCIYSDNNGQTWTYSESWILTANFGFEPAINVDSDNNLIMAMRTKSDANAPFIGFAKSFDAGKNWQFMHLDKIVGQSNQSHFIYDESIGAHILSHSLSMPQGWRRNHRLSISYDDCNTFPLSYAPFPDTRFVGYSQILKYADGIYLLVFEGNPTKNSGNSTEEIAIQLFTAQELFNNVNRS